jgi:hypothetical protein
MHDCEYLASHVTVYLSQFLYIDILVYVANLLCFSTGCNKLHIYTGHIWWCWRNGHLFTIRTNGNPYSIPRVSLGSFVILLTPCLLHPICKELMTFMLCYICLHFHNLYNYHMNYILLIFFILSNNVYGKPFHVCFMLSNSTIDETFKLTFVYRPANGWWGNF